MKPVKYSKELKEFETVGFIKSQPDLLKKLRMYYEPKIFGPGNKLSVGKSDAKYGLYDIFGDRICYYYDTRREDDFTNFLVAKFLEKNPNPNSEIRKVFTRLLHNYGLCWFGCRHEGKKRFYKNQTRIEKQFDENK
jgi:hypothetical protein